MANFLGKSKDLSLISFELSFPSVGTRTLTEPREITPGRDGERFVLSDPDIYGNVSTIENKNTKLIVKVKLTKNSDDEAFLIKCHNSGSKLGSCVYIDNSGDNKLTITGQGGSVKQLADRTNNTDSDEAEYEIQFAKSTYTI
jgi:hypothetical protein